MPGKFKDKRHNIFISYSQWDRNIVTPIYLFLQSSREDIVFYDTFSLKPGTIWENAIETAISECEILYVFWCSHTANSKAVSKEYKLTISKNKTVIPVLLDNSELPSDLSVYHGIDFRNTKFHASMEVNDVLKACYDDGKIGKYLEELGSIINENITSNLSNE